MSENWIEVGNIEKFEENKAKLVSTNGLGQVVVVLQNGTYHVLSGICTHEEFELDDAPVQEGQITCLLHMSAFDLNTGEVLDPPADEDLPVFETKVENSILYAKKNN